MSSPDQSAIVLATNGEPREIPAYRFAALEARATGRPLAVVHVVHGSSAPDRHHPVRYSYESVDVEARHLVDRACQRLRELTAGTVEIRGETPRGLAVHQLLARSRGAHLLVLQGRERSRVTHPLSPSTSVALAERAPAPVVSVPLTWDSPTPELRRVVVGVDALPRPPRLLDRALELAAEHHVPLLVVHVHDPHVADVHGPGNVGRRDDRKRAEIQLCLEHLRSHHPDVSVEVMVEHGAPDDVLTSIAGSMGILVLGRRDTDHPVYEHLGSLTRRMLHSAQMPLVVVPQPLDQVVSRPRQEPASQHSTTAVED